MDDKELRKLSRMDLLEMLIEQSKEVDTLKIQVEQLTQQLESRRIIAQEAGSIAQAALQLNDVFNAAQQAADQYLENIASISRRCHELEELSRYQANQYMNETKKKCTEMELETQKRCEEMLVKARKEAQSYWLEVLDRLDSLTKRR